MPEQTSEVDAVLAALQHSNDRLAKTVTPLSDDEVERPSYHSWSIAQVLSHLGSGAEIFGLRLESGKPGAEPDPLDPQPIWDRWNAKSPQDQVGDGLAADADFLDKLAAVAATDDGSWRVDLFGHERDLAGLAGMRLGEHAVHTWDVVVALEPTAGLPDDAAAIVVDQLAMLVAWTGKPAPGLRVRVETTGTDRVFLLAESDGKAELTATDPGGDLPTVRLPAEAFVRLVYGRLDADHTPAGVSVDGVQLDDLRGTFPGV